MDRGIDSPDRAFQGRLSSFGKRLMAVERRIRWPGATQLAEATGVNVVEDDGLIETTLVTLDLDPGRWLVIAGTNIEQSGTAPFRLNVNITETLFPAVATFYGSSPIGGEIVPLTTFGLLELDEITTIIFEASYIVYAGVGTATANDVYVIAVPT